MNQVSVGDRVLFHYVEAHVCGGVNCKCDDEAPKQSREAVITAIIDDEGVPTLALEVEFSPEEVAIHGWSKEQTCPIANQDTGTSSRSGWTLPS